MVDNREIGPLQKHQWSLNNCFCLCENKVRLVEQIAEVNFFFFLVNKSYELYGNIVKPMPRAKEEDEH